MPTQEQERDYPDLAVPRRTADYTDPHVGWTAQSGEPFPGLGYNPSTKFRPDELPDPDAAVAAGLLPQGIPDVLVEDGYVRQSPLTELAPDHEVRDDGRDEAEERDAATNVPDVAYERAKAQVEGTSAPKAKASKAKKAAHTPAAGAE